MIFFAGFDHDIGFTQTETAAFLDVFADLGDDHHVLQRQRIGRGVFIGDAVLQVEVLFHLDQRLAEIGDAHQRGAPFGDRAEIGHIPAQRRVDLVEGTDGHHQLAEGESAGEIGGGGNDDRNDDHQPAIAGRNPGEIGIGHGKPLDDCQDRADIGVDAPTLVLLAAGNGNCRHVLIGMHQREAKLGFFRKTVGIELHQLAPDDLAQHRGGSGIENRRPDHVARNGEAVAADAEDEAARKLPEHADEAHQENGRLQQAENQSCRAFGEVAGILVQALVRIDSDQAAGGEPQRPLALQPLVDQIARQAFAHIERGHLVQPGLQHVEQQQRAGDHREDFELVEEFAEVAALQRVVERSIPLVQNHLAVGRRQDNEDQHGRQKQHPATHFRIPEC